MKNGFILIIRNANIIGLTPASRRHRRQSAIFTVTRWFCVYGGIWKAYCIMNISNLASQITVDHYRQQLLRLNEEIKQKRSFTGKGKRPVKLLHDNATPHVGKPVKDTLMALGWEVLSHPAYSPDIVRIHQNCLMCDSKHLKKCKNGSMTSSPRKMKLSLRKAFVNYFKIGHKLSW